MTLDESDTDASGLASVQWQVSFDGGDYVTDPTLTTLTPQFTFPTYGDYDLLVTVTDNNGETSEDGFHVTVTEDTPTASGVTATGPVVEGGTVTFTVAAADPDTLDTVSIYADWQGDGTFDQIDDSQVTDNGDGSLSFDHVYTQPGNFTALIRLGDDGGQDTDYPVNVVVQPVAPRPP